MTSTPARAARLLGAATVATVAITGWGVVLLGPAASPGTANAAPAKDDVTTTLSVENAVQRTPTVALPEVVEQEHADFLAGEKLSKGFRVFNTGGNSSGMTMSGGLMVHGKPIASGAAGFLETKLHGDVRLLGATARFHGSESGSVALVGWQSSLVDAHRKSRSTPATGLRLVAAPGSWELSIAIEGDVQIIGSGTYEAPPGPATFEILRDGTTLYVVDPVGAVSVVKDKRAEKLAGPWASWGLTETGPDQTPASIQEVWAG